MAPKVYDTKTGEYVEVRLRSADLPIELIEEAERLLYYWERHAGDPEAVRKWAIEDMLGLLRWIVEGEK